MRKSTQLCELQTHVWFANIILPNGKDLNKVILSNKNTLAIFGLNLNLSESSAFKQDFFIVINLFCQQYIID